MILHPVDPSLAGIHRRQEVFQHPHFAPADDPGSVRDLSPIGADAGTEQAKVVPCRTNFLRLPAV